MTIPDELEAVTPVIAEDFIYSKAKAQKKKDLCKLYSRVGDTTTQIKFRISDCFLLHIRYAIGQLIWLGMTLIWELSWNRAESVEFTVLAPRLLYFTWQKFITFLLDRDKNVMWIN